MVNLMLWLTLQWTSIQSSGVNYSWSLHVIETGLMSHLTKTQSQINYSVHVPQLSHSPLRSLKIANGTSFGDFAHHKTYEYMSLPVTNLSFVLILVISSYVHIVTHFSYPRSARLLFWTSRTISLCLSRLQ